MSRVRSGRDPVILRGGISAKTRRLALGRLRAPTDSSPLLVVAAGSFIGEGFDCDAGCPIGAAPIAFKGRLVQYVGRILRPHPGKIATELYDYHDIDTGVVVTIDTSTPKMEILAAYSHSIQAPDLRLCHTEALTSHVRAPNRA